MGYRKPYYNEDHKLVRYGVKDFFSDAVSSVISFFSPKKIKHAFIGVLKGFRTFSAFFIALLLLQSAFWLIWLRQDSFSSEAKKEAYSGSGCNLIVEGIEQEAWTELYNRYFVFAEERTPSERGYTEYSVEHYYTASADSLYRMRFWLIDDSIEYSRGFRMRYGLDREEFSFSYGERTGYLGKIEAGNKKAGLTSFFLGVLAAAVVSLLFYIMTNRNKFMYGIYISFGGGFHTLMETAGWEMFAVALLTFAPAAALACGIYAAFCTASGAEFVFNAARVPAALLWVLAVVLVAVVPGVYALTSQTPVRLLSAGDNSNYVSSPRRSFRIFGKSFPFHYEFFGFVRFRRYYIMLISSAVVFTTLFSCGLFLADMRSTDENADRPSFILSTGSDVLDPDDIDAFDDIPGVAYTMFGESVYATEKRSFLLLNKRQAAGISSKTVKDKKTGLIADNNCRYSLLTPRLAEEAEKGLWAIDGNLGSVAESVDTVAVSCSINNLNVMDFRPGDTVRIALFESAGSPISFEKPDRKYQLSTLLSGAYFDYIDVRIGAVVDDGDTGDTYAVYMSPELFSRVTGRSGDVKEVSVFLLPSVKTAEVAGIREKIVKIMSGYDGYSIVDTDAVTDRRLSAKNSAAPPVLCVSFMILALCPAVWFLAQADFVSKRDREIYMLTAFGATEGDLRRLFWFSGGLLTLSASVMTATLGSLLNYLVYYTVNVFLPSLGMGSSVRYSYSFSLWGFVLCVAVTAAGAMLSTLVPFEKFIRERKKLTDVGAVVSDK